MKVQLWFDPACPFCMAATDGFFELKRTRSEAPARLRPSDLDG